MRHLGVLWLLSSFLLLLLMWRTCADDAVAEGAACPQASVVYLERLAAGPSACVEDRQQRVRSEHVHWLLCLLPSIYCTSLSL